MNQADKQWIDEYENIAKNPDKWLDKASSLIYAADKLLIKDNDGPPLPHRLGIYMMLSSFAIENMIKCIIIKKDPTRVNNGILVNSILRHDLPKLFQDAGINCKPSEEELLNRFSRFAIIWGRYPVFKSWEQYKRAVYDEGTKKRRRVFTQQDLNTIKDIIANLQDELKKLGIKYEIDV